MEKQTETKVLLNNAIKELLCDGVSLDTLTISYLTNKAGVSRRTFYRHFKKIEDLLAYSVKEDINIILSFFKKDKDNYVVINFKSVLVFILENNIFPKQLGNHLFISFINQALNKHLNEFFNEGVIINDFKYDIDTSKKDILISYIVDNFLSVINSWAVRGFIDDIDILSFMVSNITIEIIKELG